MNEGGISSLELGMLRSLGNLTAIDGVAWDMLGEHLLLRFQAGRPGARQVPVCWALPHALAADLHTLLGQALLDKDSAAAPMQ